MTIRFIESWAAYQTRADMLRRWTYQAGNGGVLSAGGVMVDGSTVSYCNAHFAPLSTVRVGFLHRCDARPPSVTNSSFLHLMQGGETNRENQIGLGMNPNGTVSIFYGVNFSGLGGVTLANGTTQLAVGVGYWIELYVVLSTSNTGSVELRINGATEIVLTGIRTSATSNPIIDGVSLCAGAGSKHWTGPFYIGDGADGWMGAFLVGQVPVASLALPSGVKIAGEFLESIEANMGAIQQVLLATGGGSAASWRTLIDWTADTSGSSTGWGTYTVRHVYQVAAATGYPGLGAGGSKIRIKLKGGASPGLSVSKAYVGVRASSGDVYDFASTPTQITWGGGASVTAGFLTNSALSDEISFSFDGTKDLIISLYFDTSSNLLTSVADAPGAAGTVRHYVAGDSAATVNASAGQAATVAYAVSLVEIYG